MAISLTVYLYDTGLTLEVTAGFKISHIYLKNLASETTSVQVLLARRGNSGFCQCGKTVGTSTSETTNTYKFHKLDESQTLDNGR